MMLAAEAPNIADWIAAIGQAAGALFTAAAVGVAVWLGWRDRRWRRADQAVVAAERDDREAAQARMITVEPVYPDRFGEPVETVVAKVTNRSRSPLLDVHLVQVRSTLEPRFGWTIAYRMHEGAPTHRRILAVDEPFQLHVEMLDPSSGKPVYIPGDDNLITVEFTDANGLRWMRTNNRPPKRVIVSPEPSLRGDPPR